VCRQANRIGVFVGQYPLPGKIGAQNAPFVGAIAVGNQSDRRTIVRPASNNIKLTTFVGQRQRFATAESSAWTL